MLGRRFVNNVVKRCVKRFPGSIGPRMDTTSGSTVSSIVENALINCSNNDFLGSTFVGDKHVSNVLIFGSVVKLNDCFFFALDGVLLDVRKIVFLLSLDADDIGKSLGGLVFCGSEFASGSVFPALPSFPLLSARSIMRKKFRLASLFWIWHRFCRAMAISSVLN